MPKGAKILSVAYWKNQICLWAIVEADEKTFYANPDTDRRIVLCGTGHTLRDDISDATFIGSVVLAPDQLIFHVFDYGEVE